ncbi:MAG: type I-A CRISPR-associated protein Cas7/Csa2 [Acidilobaceae archaeon]
MPGREVVALSVASRILVNAEALNMAESVGNVTRHRRAPVVVSSQGGGYSVFYVPAVSGESLAHHYQRLLASIAAQMGLPVTRMDLQGFFLKYSSSEVIGKHYQEVGDVVKLAKPCDVEKRLVGASVVADVGGFLYTDKLVKRTSRIRFGYMLPALDAVEKGAVASYPQLHVRYSPEAVREEQALYYVESGSSLYTLSAVLIASDIAELEYCENPDPELQRQKKSRVEAAVKALIAMLDGMAFGAKRSRYLPQWEVRSLLVGVSKGPVEYVVSPATRPSYVESSAKRAKVVKEFAGASVELHLYDSESLAIPDELKGFVVQHGSHSEALKAAVERVLKMI